MTTEEKQKEIRDPIHGLIFRRPKEIAVIDTCVFQRLRKIRQLAMAHLVYPGALHTRFEHSIGAMHIASKICDHLKGGGEKISAKEERQIRLAALLHDIGQGPFSHISEFLLEKYADRKTLGDIKDTGKIHERLTIDIIEKDAEICGVLTEADKTNIILLLKGSLTRDFKHDIISSSLDADKMDYLLRDSYYAGVKYGFYDLARVIDALRVIRRGNESYLVVHHESIYALEQLVLAKYHMMQQVFTHRVRCITDTMIIRGLTLAIKDGNEEIRKLYSYDGSSDFINNYIKYDDEKVINIVCNQTDSERAKDIFKRLRDRKLYKQVCWFTLGEREVDDAIVRGELVQLDFGTELEATLEAEIAKVLKIDSRQVIIHLRKVKNPTFVPSGYKVDPEETYILDRDGKLRKLSEFPDTVFSFPNRPESQYEIHVFAPMDNWASLDDKDKNSLQNKLKDTILNSVGS